MIFTKKRVYKSLLIAVPVGLNALLDMINILVDLIMVGVISSESIVALGVGMSFVMLIYSVITIFFVGTNAIVSRFYGTQDIASASSALFSLALFSMLFSIPIALLSIYFAEDFYNFIGVSAEVTLLGVPYLYLLAISMPFLFAKVVFISALNGCGDSRFPLYVKIFGSIANVILNYIFIYGKFGMPALGVVGAGLTTLFVHIIELLIIFYFIKMGKRELKILFKFNFTHIKRAFKVGVPTGVERFFTFLSFILFAKFIAAYGTYSLAGYQIGVRAEGLAFMPGIGFMIATMVLVGQNLGAKNEKEAELSVYVNLLLSSIVMGVIGVIFIIFAQEIASIFSSEIDSIKEASSYLFIVAFSQIPLAFVFVLEGALRGAGATKITFMVNSLSIWLLRVLPIYLISSYLLPLYYIFLVITLETFLRATIFWYIFKKGYWRGIEV